LKPLVTPSKGRAVDSNDDTGAAAVTENDDDVDAITAALAGTAIDVSSTAVATTDDTSSNDNDDAALVQAAKAWRVVDIKVLKDVWVGCSSKECAPVQVQVDFLGPYSSA
jgi:hypothetical protein